MATRQPEQQQQGALTRAYPCPSCNQPMKIVGRESAAGSHTAHLLTFQCGCGQVIASMTQ